MYDELVKRLREHNGWALNETLDKAADAIEDLENKLNLWRHDKISRWIPVTERLPDEHQPVLAYCADDDFYYISRMHKSFEDYDITHWMPITLPPKEET